MTDTRGTMTGQSAGEATLTSRGTTAVPQMASSSSSSATNTAAAATAAAAEEEQFDDEEDASQLAGGSGRRRFFSKELRCMMYGFGDDQNPYTESVDLLEDLVIEFITQMTQRAMEVGRNGRVQVEDIMYLVRKDPRKYARVRDLLSMNEELKKARKAFDEVKYAAT